MGYLSNPPNMVMKILLKTSDLINDKYRLNISEKQMIYMKRRMSKRKDKKHYRRIT